MSIQRKLFRLPKFFSASLFAGSLVSVSLSSVTAQENAAQDNLVPQVLSENNQLLVDGGNNKDASTRLLNRLFVRQWLSMDETGRISGQVRRLSSASNLGLPLDAMRVSLVRKGFRNQFETNSSGRFTFSVPQPGRYTLIVQGKDCYSVFALHILEKSRAANLLSEIEVPVHLNWNDELHRRVQSQVMPNVSWTEDEYLDGIDSGRLDNLSMSVASDPAGNLIGNIRSALPRAEMMDYSTTNLFISSNGTEVKRLTANRDGSFMVPGLATGHYGFVAVGPRGVAVLGFNFESKVGKAIEASINPIKKFVSFSDNPMVDAKKVSFKAFDALNVELASPEDSMVPPLPTEETMSEDAPFAENVGGFGGGGFGGGGTMGGGGGGGGGVGGAGGLLGAAGLAGAAAGVNDNNNFIIPQPASPIK